MKKSTGKWVEHQKQKAVGRKKKVVAPKDLAIVTLYTRGIVHPSNEFVSQFKLEGKKYVKLFKHSRKKWIGMKFYKVQREGSFKTNPTHGTKMRFSVDSLLKEMKYPNTAILKFAAEKDKTSGIIYINLNKSVKNVPKYARTSRLTADQIGTKKFEKFAKKAGRSRKQAASIS